MRKVLTTVAVALVATTAVWGQKAERVFLAGPGAHGVDALVAAGGPADAAVWGQAAVDHVHTRLAELGGRGSEVMEVSRVQADGLGQVHVRMQQRINGLPVLGAELIVHSDHRTGRVLVVNGVFAPDTGLAVAPVVGAAEALSGARADLGITRWNQVTTPRLVYAVNGDGAVALVWSAVVRYRSLEGPERDRILADATTGRLFDRHPMIHRAKNRKTYTANNGTSLPGTLLFNEGGSSSDQAAMAAYNNAGTTYDYFWTKHSRDSYNGSGATISSTVHYSSNYNNAFWNGAQMVYGDGDGTQFTYLSKALDVVAHELTHAVTEYEANLVYNKESGALNESMSDVFGAAAEAYADGAVSANTWRIGEDIYTPNGSSTDALRYMDNPTADGYSKDYYPERLYPGSCTPNPNTNDNCGVHGNSGISNLAFKLLVTGGTHPRSKTTVNVPAIGMTKAEKIFYRALSVYMTSTSNFEAARTATAQSAKDLYGATDESNVHKAWDAVGVPGGPVSVTTLSNGQVVSSLSGSTGTWKHYKITVPSGQTSLVIKTSGGSGDVDLYVKLGSSPTSSSYDYRPYLSGNNETVTVNNPAAGDWYIGLYAYSTYSGVTLQATYAGGGGGSCSGTAYTGSLSSGGNAYQPTGSYYYSSVSGTHTGALTGPAGTDFDLYLQKWNGSTWASVKSSTGSTSTENVSYSGTSGYYRWRIHAYSGSGTYNLCTTKP